MQVLEGSPWLQSRKLSVLAAMDPSGEGATTFTMRTSVRRPRVEAEITKVRLALTRWLLFRGLLHLPGACLLHQKR